MDCKNQKIKCTVQTCEYNDCKSNMCELNQIEVQPCPECLIGTPMEESMCGSFKNKNN